MPNAVQVVPAAQVLRAKVQKNKTQMRIKLFTVVEGAALGAKGKVAPGLEPARQCLMDRMCTMLPRTVGPSAFLTCAL